MERNITESSKRIQAYNDEIGRVTNEIENYSFLAHELYYNEQCDYIHYLYEQIQIELNYIMYGKRQLYVD